MYEQTYQTETETIVRNEFATKRKRIRDSSGDGKIIEFQCGHAGLAGARELNGHSTGVRNDTFRDTCLSRNLIVSRLGNTRAVVRRAVVVGNDRRDRFVPVRHSPYLSFCLSTARSDTSSPCLFFSALRETPCEHLPPPPPPFAVKVTPRFWRGGEGGNQIQNVFEPKDVKYKFLSWGCKCAFWEFFFVFTKKTGANRTIPANQIYEYTFELLSL